MTTDLGKPIAYGRTAEIYPWEQGRVLKLFYNWLDRGAVEEEARIARAVHASGLPAPELGELVEVNGRRGLVYERITGTNMAEMLFHAPWRGRYYARRMAELHAQIHGIELPAEIHAQRERITGKINSARDLSSPLRARILAALESLPDGRQLCHGDFHPGNIMITGQGEIIIDWIDASHGSPLADLARTTIILIGHAEAGLKTHPLEKTLARLFHAAYLRRYFQLRPGNEAAYRRWLPVIAAARLSENIPELEDWLVAQAEKAG